MIFENDPFVSADAKMKTKLLLSVVALFLCVEPHLIAEQGDDNPTGVAGIYNGSVGEGADPYTGNELKSISDITMPSRAYRVVQMDAGHLGQTFQLTATALGLDSFVMAALQDSLIERCLGVDEITEGVVYAVAAGRVGARAFG